MSRWLKPYLAVICVSLVLVACGSVTATAAALESVTSLPASVRASVYVVPVWALVALTTVPVVTVPSVVIAVEPAHVDSAVFSTKPRPTSPLTKTTSPMPRRPHHRS